MFNFLKNLKSFEFNFKPTMLGMIAGVTVSLLALALVSLIPALFFELCWNLTINHIFKGPACDMLGGFGLEGLWIVTMGSIILSKDTK